MKRISNIFLPGVVAVVLLAAACAPVEEQILTPAAQAETSSPIAVVTDTSATPLATATDTTLTPSIPVTGLELIQLDCQYCVDTIAHAQLVIPRDASFRVTSPPELANSDDDDDGDGGHRRTAQLSGAAEVPGPGDPDGSGTATIRLSLEADEMCFDLTASNIGPATAAHIHEGAEGVAGEVVVPLDPAPAEGSSSGCLSDVDNALLQNIIENPEQYYVNVHNEEFPDGAIRGQLARVDSDEDDDDNEDRLGCRVIDRFRDKKLVLCRAEENTTITMNVCMDENNCTEVQLTLQACALVTGTPTVTSTLVTTATASTTTLTPIVITATATSLTSTATSTLIVPPTGSATPTSSLTNTPVASPTSTATSTFTPTSTPTP